MRTAAAVVATMLSLGACSGDAAGSEAFCNAAREVIDLGTVDEIPPELDTMVEEAPDEIKDSAETVGAAFEDAFGNQDLSAIQTDEFQDAARDVREYAVENCENVEDISGE